MNMKTRNKIMLLALCMVALIAVSVLGTMAYLTSKDTVTNTFTVGKVSITLDEAKVNDNGQPIDKNKAVVENPALAERVKSNSYKLMPGHTYTKDPTVTVLANSEEAYVRTIVTVTFKTALTEDQLKTDLTNIFTGYSDKWVRKDKQVTSNSEGNTVITYEYRYVDGNDTVNATTEDTKLAPLFTAVEIPEKWDNKTLSDFGGFEISIVAEAIQADGFKTADTAWTAFDAQQ